MQTKRYLQETEEVLKDLGTCHDGLSEEEAQRRLQTNGKNKLAETKKDGIIKKFFLQLINPMIIVLLVAAVVNLITVIIDRAGGGSESYAEFIIIVGVVLLNAILGVIQEGKAEQAIEALKKMTASTCKIIRGGKLLAIKNEDIVEGDIVIIEAGDSIPADCRILESASLKVEEAALTGESLPSLKQSESLSVENGKEIALGDRSNMLYMGSTAVYGRAKAVVTATGMNTEMGKIADILAKTKAEVTPLQKKLNSLSKILSFIVLGISIFIFAFRLLTTLPPTLETVLESFIIAVSLAVAAIPEGLATVVTIVLSLGMTKMAKNKAVVKKLTAVETLGCTQVICSDKTGTLTQNKMTVVDHFGDDEKLLATAMALCCDAILDCDIKSAKGEPTECALVNYAYSLGFDKNQLDVEQKRISEAPFDSLRKMMSTLHDNKTGVIQYTKGAPDEILRHCSFYLDGGKVLPLDEKKRAEILSANKNMADKALRVLAVAYRNYDILPQFKDSSEIEKELVFIGLCGMIDPVRPEVKDAIALCKSAGIRPVMITGDHKDTAVAIAKELGIISSADEALTGLELNELSDEEFDKIIEKVSVYARVQPEHKVRIVNAFKKKNYITAMTGDGVNDAPGIKSADIGIGMGITGTDVTKSAADMVLQDDNFATIVSAVGEGRKIYENIRKTIQFLLSSNLAEVLSVFLATMLGFTLLNPMHLLWINLITDTFPALALGMEEGEENIMKRKPRKSDENIFAGGIGLNVAIQGIFIGLITVLAYLIGNYLQNGVWQWKFDIDSGIGMTMAFLTISLAESFHSFNARSIDNSIFSPELFKKQNIWLWGAFILSIILTLTVVFIPGLSSIFEFADIGFEELGISFLLGLSIIPFTEIEKVIKNVCLKNKKK